MVCWLMRSRSPGQVLRASESEYGSPLMGRSVNLSGIKCYIVNSAGPARASRSDVDFSASDGFLDRFRGGAGKPLSIMSPRPLPPYADLGRRAVLLARA